MVAIPRVEGGKSRVVLHKPRVPRRYFHLTTIRNHRLSASILVALLKHIVPHRSSPLAGRTLQFHIVDLSAIRSDIMSENRAVSLEEKGEDRTGLIFIRIHLAELTVGRRVFSQTSLAHRPLATINGTYLILRLRSSVSEARTATTFPSFVSEWD